MQHPLAFPSPSQGVWHLGPFPLRAYALMIILGIVVAVWLGERRWAARGGTPGVIIDIAVWAVPFGLVGGRLYHVITDNQMYFGAGRHPVDALKVWNGGLGIWGAVALGAVGAYIGCRRRGINIRPFADAVAPGIALAQGFGRWGNWFNQELYGRPTTLPWAVTIDPEHRPRLPDGGIDPHYADLATYHPTFLYESLWCFGVAILVIWAGKRFKLNYGRGFALYVAAYTVGRAWIEWLRIDNAHHFLGLRLNDYTALVVFLGAVAYLYVYRGKGDVEEVLEERPPGEPDESVGEREQSAKDPGTGPERDELAAQEETPHPGTPYGETPHEETPHEETPHEETPHEETPRGEGGYREPGAFGDSAMDESAESPVASAPEESSGEAVSALVDHGEPADPGPASGHDDDEAARVEPASSDRRQVPAAKRWWQVTETLTTNQGGDATVAGPHETGLQETGTEAASTEATGRQATGTDEPREAAKEAP